MGGWLNPVFVIVYGKGGPATCGYVAEQGGKALAPILPVVSVVFLNDVVRRLLKTRKPLFDVEAGYNL